MPIADVVSAVAARHAAQQLQVLGFVLNCHRPHSIRSLRCRLPQVNTSPDSICCMHIRSITLRVGVWVTSQSSRTHAKQHWWQTSPFRTYSCVLSTAALSVCLVFSAGWHECVLVVVFTNVLLRGRCTPFFRVLDCCSMALEQCLFVTVFVHSAPFSSAVCPQSLYTPLCRTWASWPAYTLGCPCNRVHIGMYCMSCVDCFLQAMLCNGSADNLTFYVVPGMCACFLCSALSVLFFLLECLGRSILLVLIAISVEQWTTSWIWRCRIAPPHSSRTTRIVSSVWSFWIPGLLRHLHRKLQILLGAGV